MNSASRIALSANSLNSINNPLAPPEGESTTTVCFHCYEPVPDYCDLYVDFNGDQKPMCCIGCKSAAEFIIDQKLTRFYEHRSRLNTQDFFGEVASHLSSQNTPKQVNEKWQHLDSPDNNRPYVITDKHGYRSFSVAVDGLYCSSCTWLIEKTLQKLSKNIRFQAEIDTRRVHISLGDKNTLISTVLVSIESLGYRANLCEIGGASISESDTSQKKKSALLRIIVAGLGTMQVMTYATAGYFGSAAEVTTAEAMSPELERFFLLLSLLVSTVVVFYSGKPFFVNALNDLRNKHLGMDVPIALAIAGAYLPSVYQVLTKQSSFVYFDSAVMFVFFLSLGRYIEMRARFSLLGSRSDFNQVLPPSINITRLNNGEYQYRSIKPTEAIAGDRLTIALGDIVPFDAKITDGAAQLDESLITGESISITKRVHDSVLAGTRVLSGQIQLESIADWSNSSIAKIEQSLQAAQRSNRKEEVQSQLISRYFIGFVLLLTIVVGAIWWFTQPDRIFEVCLAMLIASCPCAFALAAPIGRAAAIHRLRGAGVLLTNNRAFNALSTVTTWCFDKTGTLTKGKPTIVNVTCFSNVSEQRCLQIIACMEQSSDHTLASAFNTINTDLVANSITQSIGSGVQADINGETYRVGKRSWVLEPLSSSKSCIDTVPKSGIEMILASSSEVLACVNLEDEIRTSAGSLIETLKLKGNALAVLSGDNLESVNKTCEPLGIKVLRGNLLPQQKLEIIRDFQSNGARVAMVGDGVNDAPVLAQADLSIAMASGSKLALNNADVVLLNGKLSRLILLNQVSTRLKKITRQNLSWALAYNLLALPLAALGLLTPWIAALGMSLSSLLVVLNALRLRSK